MRGQSPVARPVARQRTASSTSVCPACVFRRMWPAISANVTRGASTRVEVRFGTWPPISAIVTAGPTVALRRLPLNPRHRRRSAIAVPRREGHRL